jgi:diacylglycerol kinase (ATP)
MDPTTARPPTRALILANLTAGSSTEELLAQITALCAQLPQPVAVHRTKHRGDATAAVRRALHRPRPPDLVVAVGGDGTVREVVEGMAGTRSDARLTIVPAGTGNSGYRMLWGSTPWDEALAAVVADPGGQAVPRQLDLGLLEETSSLVFLGAGSGVIAEALIAAAGHPLRGLARYARTFADAAAAGMPYPGRVTVDGEVLYEGGIVLTNIGGGQYRGGQYLMMPCSELTDGLLDVCVIGDAVRPADVPELTRTASHLGLPGVSYGRGRRITVERLDGAYLCFEYDGELRQDVARSMTVRVLPNVLSVWGARAPMPAAAR